MKKRKTKLILSSPPSSKKEKQETEYYPEFQLEEKYPELSKKKIFSRIDTFCRT